MFGVATSLAALLLIAALITIHEFGHFIVAKACGVRVKVFSVGIGGRLFGVKWGDTDYRISWFPFGGYVRMAGADPFMEGGGDDDDPRAQGAFMAQPAWKRLLIVFAGPAMNLALPFVVFTALKMAGEPQPRADVGTVYAEGGAAAAGVLPDDHIVSVEGTETLTWADVSEAFASSTDAALDLIVDRGGQRIPLTIPVEAGDYGDARDPYDFGLTSLAPDTTVAVDDPASPAGRAGLATGDTLVSVGGAPVRTWNEVRRLFLAAQDPEVRVDVRRAGTEAEAGVTALTLRRDPTWVPTPTEVDDDLWQAWGLASGMVSVGEFAKDGSAASDAGVKEGDRLIAIDDQPIHVWRDVVLAVAASASGKGSEQTTREMIVTVRRAGVVSEIRVTPKVVEDTDELGRYRWRPLLGIGSGGGTVIPPLVARPYAFPDALARATDEVVLVSGFIVEQLGKLTTGEAAPQESLGGPVEIFRQTRAAAERGIFDWARQLGLFSISLGIINLLPIPVLDGGQIVMYLAEWVRGRPLPLILRERAQQAGIIFLVLLMLFVLVFDIHRAAVG
ncbi:MAG: RIP metalloprotease RseP [Pseudomonadota bacterium]|nr:RIP metalloprotease RseP [Pseudomonadota bacterium]